MADIADILRELAFYQSGGGQKSGPERFAEMLARTGQGATAVGEGFKNGADARKTALEGQKLLREVTPSIPLEIPKSKEELSQEMSVYESRMKDLEPYIRERDANRQKFLSQLNLSPTYPVREGELAQPDVKLRPELVEERLGEVGLGQVPQPERPSDKKTQMLTPKEFEDYGTAVKNMRERPQSDFSPFIADESVERLTDGKIKTGMMTNMAILKEFTKGDRAESVVKGKKEIFDANREDRINKTVLQYTESLEKNFVLREMRRQNIGMDAAVNLLGLAEEGNTVAASALGMKIARGLGEVGVLTESDVVRYIQSGQLDRKAADILSRWLQGKPTEATLNEIDQISQAIEDSFATRVQPIYDDYVNRLARNLKISPEDAAYRLAVPYSGENKGGGGDSTAFESDVLAYAKRHGITPQQAQQIKQQRTQSGR